MTRTDDSPPGPLELMESARAKYTLALGRMRRGPPELALLSLHGSLEDALRGHALRQRLAAAGDPFPQLVDALTSDARAPLEATEAEIIRRMHRLRARVAHGEQIAVAAGTIDAYRRLAARLLPRYGVLVVGPEDEGEGEAPRDPGVESAPPRRRMDDVEAIPPRHEPERGRTTARLARPPRERSAYPDDELARYSSRPRRGLPGATGRADAAPDGWRRAQPWLLPLLIIVSLFLIGAAVSISLQQIRDVKALPTAPVATAPGGATPPPRASADAVEGVNSVAATRPAAAPGATTTPSATPAAATGALAVGQRARVSTQIPLNLRDRPGAAQDNAVLLVLEPNTLVEVVDGPRQADGFTWWKVRVANSEGWCAGEYLEAR